MALRCHSGLFDAIRSCIFLLLVLCLENVSPGALLMWHKNRAMSLRSLSFILVSIELLSLKLRLRYVGLVGLLKEHHCLPVLRVAAVLLVLDPVLLG